jgi:hypothetical protein
MKGQYIIAIQLVKHCFQFFHTFTAVGKQTVLSDKPRQGRHNAVLNSELFDATAMPSSAGRYQRIYKNDLAAEAEWLRMGAKAKTDSIDLLTAPFSRPFGILCEMGCGTGAILEECVRRGLAQNYIGVDASEDALNWVRQRHQGGIRLIRHDLDQGAPELGGFADLVVISHVLEHLRRPNSLLAGLRGKCGFLMAEVPLENQPVPRTMAWFRSTACGRKRDDNLAGHVQFFFRSSFRKLLVSSGWNIIAERRYLAYQKDTIHYSSRRNGSPLWKSLGPYFASRLLGDRVASHLLCVHYAVLAVASCG